MKEPYTKRNINREGESSQFTPWGGVTNPLEHKPDSFRYLVYAINPQARVHMSMLHAMAVRDGMSSSGTAGGNAEVNLYTQPEMLTERSALAMSLIDNSHLATWGRAGLIVEVPVENVKITSPHDSGSSTFDKHLIEDQARKQPLLEPDELLSRTSPESYNEVVALADNNGSKIKLVGFFYKIADDGEPLDDNLTERMRGHSFRLQLPLVSIPNPNIFGQERIERSEGRLRIQMDGARYSIYGWGDSNFRKLDQRDFSTFLSREELVKVLSFLSENGFKHQDIHRLRELYEITDSERQKPKVKYNDQGQVTSITKSQGYGENEETLIIWGIGDSTRENVIRAAREMRKMMADPLGYQDSSVEFKLSPSEVEEIISEAVENSEPDQRAKIKEWYQKIKVHVQKMWEDRSNADRVFNNTVGPTPKFRPKDIDIKRFFDTRGKDIE